MIRIRRYLAYFFRLYPEKLFMELSPERGPKNKTPQKPSSRAIFFGFLAALLTQFLLIIITLTVSKYGEDAEYLPYSKLWWLTTALLSFMLGRYVTSKVSGVPLKSIFKWEKEKDEL
jgi:hypothetical protein